MDTTLVAALAAVLGLLVGVVGMLAFYLSEREQRGALPGPAEAEVPPGVAGVLAVLRSAAVVLAEDDTVVRATPAAYAFGVVRGGNVVHEPLLTMVRQVRRDGVIREAELELPRGPLGEGLLVVSARVAPLGPAHVLLLVEDRTEARRVEEVRRDFVANVSHELKTPVGALALLSETMQDAADDPDAVRRFASRMQRESERLSELVQEIIDLSRLQVAKGLERPDVVPLDDVVAEAVDRARLAAEAAGIAVEVGPHAGAAVYGDRGLLVTAVRNMVDNAVRYSGPGTKVVVGVHSENDIVGVSVSDQGIGIAPDEQHRVFERFYRVDPARSRETGGTGLGLSIVKHVAANHGGDVTIESRLGEGSTFTMRLPRAVLPGRHGPMHGASTGGARTSAAPAHAVGRAAGGGAHADRRADGNTMADGDRRALT